MIDRIAGIVVCVALVAMVVVFLVATAFYGDSDWWHKP